MRAETRLVSTAVNGRDIRLEVEVRTLLSDFLRHHVEVTGTHVGCEHGVCGACTVLVDGEAVRSCLMLAVQVEGRIVETIEGLSSQADLTPMQEAMRACHGLQCGFCTPGILMSMEAAERDGMSIDQATTDVLGGHLCRCTGYQNIRTALRQGWGGQEQA